MKVGLQIALADTFQRALSRLESVRLKHVHEAIVKLQDGHPSVKLHALEGVPFSAFGVNQGALRVVCHAAGDQLLLLWVDAHDAAYKWAARHRVAQVGRVVRVVATERAAAEVTPAPGTAAPGPLGYLRPKALRHLGVPEGAARVLLGAQDDDELLELAEVLRPPLGEALLALGAGAPLEAVARELEEARAAGAGAPSLAEALKAPQNSQHFVVLPPGEGALARALGGSLEDWQVFLHPSQRNLVDKDVAGPMRITGGPGTGKTVVCLHRARHLAEVRLADDPRPVLVTAFSKALASRLRAQLVQLCGVGSATLERLTVRTLVGVAQDILRSAGRAEAFLDKEDEQAAWAEALQEEALGLPAAFYAAERQRVQARYDAWTEAAYLKQARPGRGRALARTDKKAVWRVLAAFEQACLRRGGLDREALAREARGALVSGAAPQAYAAVVVDEAQDTSPGDLRLLATLTRAPEAGGARPNALTLAGDGYQRIHERPVPLSQCGIDVRGRSWRLHLNYRTTEPIRRAALEVIQDHPADPLHEDEPALGDPRDRSLRGGEAPVRVEHSDRAAEASWVADRVAEAPEETWLVLARTNAGLDAVEAELARRGGPHRRLSGEDESLPRPGVALATLHRAKGLEAPRVVVVGAEQLPLRRPPDAAMDPDAWRQQELSLLYVGMTRARDWCAVSRVIGR